LVQRIDMRLLLALLGSQKVHKPIKFHGATICT
jgi:hypothetical protein